MARHDEHKAAPEGRYVSVESLGIDWAQAEENAKKFKQGPLSNEEVEEFERDVAGILPKDILRQAIRVEHVKRSR